MSINTSLWLYRPGFPGILHLPHPSIGMHVTLNPIIDTQRALPRAKQNLKQNGALGIAYENTVNLKLT